MKKCSGCEGWKALDQFDKQAKAKDGGRSRCKACDAATRRKTHVANPEKRRSADRIRYAANPEKKRAARRAQYADNPEKERADARKRSAANPEKRSAINRKHYATNLDKSRARGRANRAANLERIAAYRVTPEARAVRSANHRERYASDAIYKLAMILRSRLNTAIRNKSKCGSAVRLLGCSIDELLVRFEGLFTEGMTWANHGAWHIDHIRPLSSLDLEDPEQLAVACHYSNLQPLWAFDNLSKGGKALPAT